MLVYVLFYLGQLSHFPSCFGAGVTNLNEPLSSFLLPPHYCGLGADSIPFRAIVNKKQCETRGLSMSLVIHYWIGDVHDSRLWEFPKCKAQYSLIVLKVPLNFNQSISPFPFTSATPSIQTASDMTCFVSDGTLISTHSRHYVCLVRCMYVYMCLRSHFQSILHSS